MKTIKVEERDWELLQKQKLSLRLNRIAQVIASNITFTKKFNNEEEFRKWFKKNFRIFGFSKIIEDNHTKTPDFVMEERNGKIKVELETLSSHFFVHKHKTKDVDLVICLLEDKKLPVKTIEVGKFEYINPQANQHPIKVSEHLHAFLMKQGVKGDTFEQVIWSLIGNKQMTRETEKDFKESKKSYEASL